MQGEFNDLFINSSKLFYCMPDVNKHNKKEVEESVRLTINNILNIMDKTRNYNKEIFYRDYKDFRGSLGNPEVNLEYAKRDLVYGVFSAYSSYLNNIDYFLELEGTILALFEICEIFKINYKKF